uniref:Uncharacterized protein n=1 Tax=Arundo donax TaxID=35708 RepID=A0A0A8ZLG5_ARUDO
MWKQRRTSAAGGFRPSSTPMPMC